MPFGLTNGPSCVIPLMNLAFSGLSWTHFLRPIGRYHHRHHRLRLVFLRRRSEGLKLKPIKNVTAVEEN